MSAGGTVFIRSSIDPVQHETGFRSVDEAIGAARTKAREKVDAWWVCSGSKTLAVVHPSGQVEWAS